MHRLLKDHEFRALFLDYTGTMVQEEEPCTMKLLQYFLTHSDLKEPKKALSVVWGLIKKLELECCYDAFIRKDAMVDRILAVCVKEYGLEGDLAYMHELWRNSWIHAPLYEDVKPFLASCPLPVYVITNDDLCYIRESFQEKDIVPAGIIAAEMVRACKPHREIFEKALDTAGVQPPEAVLVGDSMTSDILPAKEISIYPVLIDRKGLQKHTDVTVIRSLMDLLA